MYGSSLYYHVRSLTQARGGMVYASGSASHVLAEVIGARDKLRAAFLCTRCYKNSYDGYQEIARVSLGAANSGT